jgi:hypothetical protein
MGLLFGLFKPESTPGEKILPISSTNYDNFEFSRNLKIFDSTHTQEECPNLAAWARSPILERKNYS